MPEMLKRSDQTTVARVTQQPPDLAGDVVVVHVKKTGFKKLRAARFARLMTDRADSLLLSEHLVVPFQGDAVSVLDVCALLV